MTDLKTIQDWILERRFKAVPGVVDVVGWGGKTKSYEVSVDQQKLRHYGVTMPQLLQALGNSNINVGGQTGKYRPAGGHRARVGPIRSGDDIGNVILALQTRGAPVFVKLTSQP